MRQRHWLGVLLLLVCCSVLGASQDSGKDVPEFTLPTPDEVLVHVYSDGRGLTGWVQHTWVFGNGRVRREVVSSSFTRWRETRVPEEALRDLVIDLLGHGLDTASIEAMRGAFDDAPPSYDAFGRGPLLTPRAADAPLLSFELRLSSLGSEQPFQHVVKGIESERLREDSRVREYRGLARFLLSVREILEDGEWVTEVPK